MPNLTVVIPYAPMHSAIHHEAVASVKAQTLPCDLVVYYDDEMKGAGFARNRGLAAVSTPLVAFLDADDIIDPRFAEITLGILSQYAQSHEDTRYAYTDWYGINNAIIQAPEPCIAWTEKTSHVVTTVIPTARARAIGGFDEIMQGVEDADFYVRLRLSGVCGLHINAPLVSYREGGQRSITARASGQENFAKQYMTQRYGGYTMAGCCGDNTPGPIGPMNEPLEGDVLVQAQWGGNMVKRGLITGRTYPRTSYPKMLYVNESDASQSPNLFKRVTSPQAMSNGVILQPQYKPVQNWQDVVGAVYGGAQAQPSQPVEVKYNPNISGRKKADVVAKAQEWTKIEGSDVK